MNDKNIAKKGDLEEINKIRGSEYQSQNVLKIHNLFKRFDLAGSNKEEKAEIIAELKKLLGIQTTHSKPNTVTSSAFEKEEFAYPSEFPADKLKLDSWLDGCYESLDKLSKINTNYFSRLDSKKMAASNSHSVLNYYLTNVKPVDIDNYVDILVQYMKLTKSPYSDHLAIPNSIYPKLTLKHLQDLRKRYSYFMDNTTFVSNYFRREFELPEGKYLGEDLSFAERKELISKAHSWALENCPKSSSPAREFFEELVQIGVEMNEFD